VVAHIDELLKFESGRKVKMGRKARHQMTAELVKAERKAVKIVRNSKQKEARKWEAKGKSTMIKWLSSSISKRGDRKENPDRDKDGS
jgi:16S rRNA U1498 N3-methylase RsmE